jgi:hypothetical protein
MKLVALLVVATLAVALSMPVVQDEEVLLDEAYEHHVAAAVRAVNAAEKKVKASTPAPPPAPPPAKKDHASHHVANAVVEVNKGEPKPKMTAAHERANKRWAKESAKSHWHCKHCHGKCKTQHCHKWCHKKFCFASYNGGFEMGNGLGRISLNAGERVTPALVRADHAVNHALAKVETTTKMSVIRHANRAIKRFEAQKASDLRHFKRQVHREDALNKSTFPSARKRKATRKVDRALKKLHRKAEAKVAAKSIMKAKKVAADDMAYVQGAKVEAKVGKMMKMTSMLGALEKTTKLDTKYLDEKKTAGQRIQTAAKASATKVAVKLAKMKVNLNTGKKSGNKRL